MKKSLFAGALCVLASLATPVLAAGDAEAGKTKSAVCAACHGADGKAIMAEYPNLAGQGEAYLVKQLQDFKEGRRENVLMSPMAMPLSDEDMADLAAYYSSQPAIEGVAAEENLQQGMDILLVLLEHVLIGIGGLGQIIDLLGERRDLKPSGLVGL